MRHTPTVRSVTPKPRGSRRVPRAVREREMLAVAERAFAARGYHAASVDGIAEAAGITKPMVYAYFGSKEGLYRACMRAARERRPDSWSVLLGDVTAGTGPFAADGAEIRREMTGLVADLLRQAADAEGL